MKTRFNVKLIDKNINFIKFQSALHYYTWNFSFHDNLNFERPIFFHSQNISDGLAKEIISYYVMKYIKFWKIDRNQWKIFPKRLVHNNSWVTYQNRFVGFNGTQQRKQGYSFRSTAPLNCKNLQLVKTTIFNYMKRSLKQFLLVQLYICMR